MEFAAAAILTHGSDLHGAKEDFLDRSELDYAHERPAIGRLYNQFNGQSSSSNAFYRVSWHKASLSIVTLWPENFSSNELRGKRMDDGRWTMVKGRGQGGHGDRRETRVLRSRINSLSSCNPATASSIE